LEQQGRDCKPALNSIHQGWKKETKLMPKQFKVVAADRFNQRHSPFKSSLPLNLALRGAERWRQIMAGNAVHHGVSIVVKPSKNLSLPLP
jgi:hypothetical protein